MYVKKHIPLNQSKDSSLAHFPAFTLDHMIQENHMTSPTCEGMDSLGQPILVRAG